MYLNDLPKEMKDKFCNLSKDEEFQRLFAKDKILNKLQDEGNDNTIEYEHRVDEVIVDYLVSKNRIPECQREYWVAYLKYHKPDVRKQKGLNGWKRLAFFFLTGSILSFFIDSWILLIAICLALCILIPGEE